MSGIFSVVITGDALIDSNASLEVSCGEKYSTIQLITTSDPAARDDLAKIKSKSGILVSLPFGFFRRSKSMSSTLKMLLEVTKSQKVINGRYAPVGERDP